MVRILLADDHVLVLEGLRSLLERVTDFQVIDEARNGHELLEKALRLKPDIILSDIGMPQMDGAEAARRILHTNPQMPIIALTMHNDRALVAQMIDIGVKGYVLKNVSRAELETAIRKVISGESYFSPEVTLTLAIGNQPNIHQSQHMQAGQQEKLTDREREILKLIAEGLTNTEIGAHLFISPRTVDTHRTNIMKKLNIHNIAGLVRYALTQGITD